MPNDVARADGGDEAPGTGRKRRRGAPLQDAGQPALKSACPAQTEPSPGAAEPPSQPAQAPASQLGGASQARPSADGRAGNSQIGSRRFGAAELARQARSGGRAGQIAKVVVTNFMCHTHMEVEFGPHVNFISGPNGSGKSAILQALQYCLGVRATATGRAKSNAQYVKNGTESATAAVTLWNTGEEAYFPAVYGAQITIHKTLTAKGHTSTKVLDGHGNRTTLSKADDVRQLLDHLCVNAANPAIVLTQDHARGLLSGDKVNRKLFDLFVDSLGFQQTLELLQGSDESIKRQLEEVKGFERIQREHEARQEELDAMLEMAEKAKKWATLRDDLEEIMSWPVVWYLEDIVRQLQAEIGQHLPRSVTALGDEKARAEQGAEECAQQRADLAANIQALEARVTGFSKRAGEVKEAARAALAQKNAAKRKLDECVEQLRTFREKRTDALKEIARIEASSTHAGFQEQKRAWTSQREAVKQSLEASQFAQNDSFAAMQQATDRETNALRARDECKGYADHLSTEVQRLRDQLNSLRKNGQKGWKQTAVVIDRRAPALIQRAEANAHKFSKPPIGPIGAYLIVPNATQYSATISGALEKVLATWLVDNHADQELLRRLAGADCPNIIRTSYSVPRHAIPGHLLPAPDLTTIERAIEIRPEAPHRDTVFNFLVDQAHIERLVLAPDEATGLKIASPASGYRLQSFDAIWCNNATHGPVHIVATDLREEINAWPPNKTIPASMLGQGGSELESSLEGQLETAAARHAAAVHQLRAAENEVLAAAGAVRAAQQESRTNKTAIARARDRMQELENLAPQAPVDDRAALDGWQQDVVLSDAEIGRWETEKGDLERRFKEAEDGVSRANQDKSDLKLARETHQREVAALQEQQANADQRLHALRSQAAELERQQEKARNACATKEGELQEYQVGAAKAREDAESYCSETEARERKTELAVSIAAIAPEYLASHRLDVATVLASHTNMDKLVTFLEKRISKAEDQTQGHTIEWLRNERDRHHTESAIKMAEIEKVVNTVDLLRNSFHRRVRKYHELRSCTHSAIDHEFKRLLKVGRNWKGRVGIDFDQSSIELEVTPAKGVRDAGQRGVTDMKSLSGGERSFTSVSFVLALGREIRTPFFAMDEFDVFMDAVNRKVSLTSILKFAWEMQDVQFMLLSPLDMAVVQQARESVNESLRERQPGVEVEEMPASFAHTRAMQPPREGARAHFTR